MCQHQGLRALCHLWFEGLCEALPLTALNPQMSDSPSSNLGADTKKTFKTGWRGKIHRKVDFLKLDIALTPRQPVFKFSLASRQEVLFVFVKRNVTAISGAIVSLLHVLASTLNTYPLSPNSHTIIT